MTKINIEDFLHDGFGNFVYKKDTKKACPFCGGKDIELYARREDALSDWARLFSQKKFNELRASRGYWVAKILCNCCGLNNEWDEATILDAAEIMLNWWNKRTERKPQ